MAEDLDATLNEPSEADKRIKQLSENYKKTSEERDAEKVAREAAEKKAADAEKLAAFNETFVDIVAENPAAKEHKQTLKDKVMGGMSMDDAKIWLRGMTSSTGNENVSSPIGGSSPVTVTPRDLNKPLREMKSEELRQAMEEADSQGAIDSFLRGQRW